MAGRIRLGVVTLLALSLALAGCEEKKKPLGRFSADFESLQFVVDYLPKNPVVLEGGSYHGESALEIIKRWPGATVYSFEPVPELFEIVKKNTAPHKNIHPFSLALGDRVGTALFHMSAMEESPNVASASGSLLEPSHHLEGFPNVKFEKTIDVQVTTIDEWAKANGVEKLDFMWLDLQGVEFPVMKGAPRIMKTVKAIMTEVEFLELYKGQALFAEMKPWLEAQGFQMVATDFDPEAPKQADLKTRRGTSWYGNAVFARK